MDNYLNVPFDLSQVMFITTANDVSTIPPALYDRMEIINLSGYSPFEKSNIAKDHLIKKQQEKHGIENLDLKISERAINP